MIRNLVIASLLMTCCLPQVRPQQVRDTTPAVKLVLELYGDEMKRADNDPAAAARLAGQLLQEAKDTADHPAGRDALLTFAVAYAEKAGDIGLALQALEEKFGSRGEIGRAHV